MLEDKDQKHEDDQYGLGIGLAQGGYQRGGKVHQCSPVCIRSPQPIGLGDGLSVPSAHDHLDLSVFADRKVGGDGVGNVGDLAAVDRMDDVSVAEPTVPKEAAARQEDDDAVGLAFLILVGRGGDLTVELAQVGGVVVQQISIHPPGMRLDLDDLIRGLAVVPPAGSG